MARFLAQRGNAIHVTTRNQEISSRLARDIGATVGEAQDVIDAAEIVFLCLRPEIAEDVLGGLVFGPQHRIVSVMANVPRTRLAALCAPATRIVQTIPLGFVEYGGCPLAAFGDTELLEELFSPENPVIAVGSEDALNAHFAICAFVPGILDLLGTGSDWLASRTGDPVAAELYVAQLFSGFLQSIDPRAPGVLGRERDALATQGTLSLGMVEGLRRAGAHDAARAVLTEIEDRLKS